MKEIYQRLPGIGEYTAGAIASISFQEKVPAVDGNVLRVISRVLASYEDVLLAETKKKITNLLKNIMPEEAGDFNEGLMELGEKICIPTGKPLCQQCPIQSCCKAYEQDIMEKIPVRVKKSARKIEIKTVFILQYENKVAVKKREKKGLLADLYEFPNVEGKIEESEIPCILEQWNLSFKELIRKKKAKHVFTHIEWQMIAYEIEVKNVNTQFIWTTQKQRETIYPLPTAFKKLYDISNNP